MHGGRDAHPILQRGVRAKYAALQLSDELDPMIGDCPVEIPCRPVSALFSSRLPVAKLTVAIIVAHVQFLHS